MYNKNFTTNFLSISVFCKKQVRKNVINFTRPFTRSKSRVSLGTSSPTALFENHLSLSKILLGGSSIPRKSRANCSRDGHHRRYRLPACPAKYAYPSHLDAITKAIGIGKYLIRLVQREARLGRAGTSEARGGAGRKRLAGSSSSRLDTRQICP